MDGRGPAQVRAGDPGGADSGTKRNGLSEADPDVPAKLLEQGLERGEEAEALPRRQVVGENDLLQEGFTQLTAGLAEGHGECWIGDDRVGASQGLPGL